MATKNVELRRKVSGTFTTENIAVRSDWSIIDNKPDVFTPAAHTHDVDDINATGTLDNTTFLRGDGVWATSANIVAFENAAGDGLVWDAANEELDVIKSTTLQAQDGTNDDTFMTPLKTLQAILANTPDSGVSKDDLQNVYLYGKASAAITKGQAVQFAGAQGDHILIKPAVQSEVNANPNYMIGIAETDLALNDFGYVIVNGRLNLDTSSFSAGDILYFDSEGTTQGALTATEPTEPNAIIEMAAVSIDGVGTGEFVIRTTLITRKIDEINGLQDALDNAVTKSSVEAVLTGDITTHNHDTRYYTKSQTDTEISNAVSNLVDSSPTTLDTLNELAAALGDDPNFATTVSNSIGQKADIEYYTLTIASGDWSGTEPTTAVKTVSGVLSTDRPLIDLDLSSVAFADVETRQTEYGKLYRVSATANNEITFYALEAPTESLDISIKVVR